MNIVANNIANTRMCSEIQWHSEMESDHCGYCTGNTNPHSIKHAFVAKVLFADDYDDLMNAGWRRSGDFCYKPVMHKVSMEARLL